MAGWVCAQCLGGRACWDRRHVSICGLSTAVLADEEAELVTICVVVCSHVGIIIMMRRHGVLPGSMYMIAGALAPQ